MRECEYYQELMSRLLDEDLSEEEQSALREHARVCPDCRRVFSAFTGMTAALRDDLAEPPRDLAWGVMERVHDEARKAPARHRGPDRPVRRLRSWTRLATAACLVLVVAGAAAVALQSRAKSVSEGSAPTSVMDSAEMQPRFAGAADAGEEEAGESESAGSQPMTASIQEDSALYSTEEIPTEEAADTEEYAAQNSGADEAPAPEPSPEPLAVYDAARTRVGSIAPENIPAFEQLITDGGSAEGSFEYLLKVVYDSKTYAFATDDQGGLIWWEEPSAEPLYSPGTLAQLHELITMDPPALPE